MSGILRRLESCGVSIYYIVHFYRPPYNIVIHGPVFFAVIALVPQTRLVLPFLLNLHKSTIKKPVDGKLATFSASFVPYITDITAGQTYVNCSQSGNGAVPFYDNERPYVNRNFVAKRL